jgi:hypothetical protein
LYYFTEDLDLPFSSESDSGLVYCSGRPCGAMVHEKGTPHLRGLFHVNQTNPAGPIFGGSPRSLHFSSDYYPYPPTLPQTSGLIIEETSIAMESYHIYVIIIYNYFVITIDPSESHHMCNATFEFPRSVQYHIKRKRRTGRYADGIIK